MHDYFQIVEPGARNSASFNKKLRDLYFEQGYVVIRSKKNHTLFSKFKAKFESAVLNKFTNNPEMNRELIKRFSDFPELKRFYYSRQISAYMKAIDIARPVACGPLITHYTNNDSTGAGFFAKIHQDWPSMASSQNSCIVWCSLSDCIQSDEHGILVYPKMHQNGLLKGSLTKHGYQLDDLDTPPLNLNLQSGDILIMNSFLPHGTYFSSNSKRWKLSLSQRFDDLNCSVWKTRMYKNAYTITVDRYLYKKYD